MGPKGETIDTVKWSLLVHMAATVKKVTYGILAAIKKAKKDLPIEYTTAVFMLQPNKTNSLQDRYLDKIIYIHNLKCIR